MLDPVRGIGSVRIAILAVVTVVVCLLFGSKDFPPISSDTARFARAGRRSTRSEPACHHARHDACRCNWHVRWSRDHAHTRSTREHRGRVRAGVNGRAADPPGTLPVSSLRCFRPAIRSAGTDRSRWLHGLSRSLSA